MPILKLMIEIMHNKALQLTNKSVAPVVAMLLAATKVNRYNS